MLIKIFLIYLRADAGITFNRLSRGGDVIASIDSDLGRFLPFGRDGVGKILLGPSTALVFGAGGAAPGFATSENSKKKNI